MAQVQTFCCISANFILRRLLIIHALLWADCPHLNSCEPSAALVQTLRRLIIIHALLWANYVPTFGFMRTLLLHKCKLLRRLLVTHALLWQTVHTSIHVHLPMVHMVKWIGNNKKKIVHSSPSSTSIPKDKKIIHCSLWDPPLMVLTYVWCNDIWEHAQLVSRLTIPCTYF